MYFIWLQFLSHRSIVVCPAISIVKQDPNLYSIGLNQWKQVENRIRDEHKLNELLSAPNKSHKLESQRKRRDTVNLICIDVKSNYFPSGIHTCPMLSDFEKQMVLLAESKNNGSGSTSSEPPKNDQNRPSEQQLQRVFNVLSQTVCSSLILFS